MQYTTSRIYYSFIAGTSAFLGLSSKESACSAGDGGSIPGWKTSPKEGNGNPLQYSCLGNLMDREKLGGLQSRESQKNWT